MLRETATILELLGIDQDDLEWEDLAICSNMDTELFYDQYESSDNVAKMVDEICLSCPVRTQCLMKGVESGQHGVWGGVYLSSGKTDEGKNSHKTEEVWQRIRDSIA